VPRPGSIHFSISCGSTASNNSSRRVVRIKKKSSDVEELSPTPEVPVKELEVKEGTEKVAAEDREGHSQRQQRDGRGYGCC
jgi:hypothetical protein